MTNDLLIDSLESLNLYNTDSSWNMDMRKHKKGILTTKSRAFVSFLKKSSSNKKTAYVATIMGL